MFFDKSLFLKQKLKIQRLIVVLYMDQERHRFATQNLPMCPADFLPLLSTLKTDWDVVPLLDFKGLGYQTSKFVFPLRKVLVI